MIGLWHPDDGNKPIDFPGDGFAYLDLPDAEDSP